METTLHRQLKEHYCSDDSQLEVKLGRYRIDVVSGDRLIEIQHSGLSAIGRKISNLVQDHCVDVVKPIVLRKKIIKLSRKNGKVVSQRFSPRRGGFLDLFDELLYFTRVFPHERLRIITPLIEVEEIRYPGHGRRRWKRHGDFVVKDRLLNRIVDSQIYQTAQDLHRHLPPLNQPFDTRQVAESLEIKRWQAQRMAYVLRKTGSIRKVGKKGNSLLYKLAASSGSGRADKRHAGRNVA